jgi:hypothetical protein
MKKRSFEMKYGGTMVLAGVVAAIFWVKTKHDAKLLASELNLLEGELSRPVLYGVGIVVAVVIIVASHYLHLKEFANLVFGDKSVGQMAHELEHRGDEMMHGIVQLQKASQQEKDLPVRRFTDITTRSEKHVRMSTHVHMHAILLHSRMHCYRPPISYV